MKPSCFLFPQRTVNILYIYPKGCYDPLCISMPPAGSRPLSKMRTPSVTTTGNNYRKDLFNCSAWVCPAQNCTITCKLPNTLSLHENPLSTTKDFYFFDCREECLGFSFLFWTRLRHGTHKHVSWAYELFGAESAAEKADTGKILTSLLYQKAGPALSEQRGALPALGRQEHSSPGIGSETEMDLYKHSKSFIFPTSFAQKSFITSS